MTPQQRRALENIVEYYERNEVEEAECLRALLTVKPIAWRLMKDGGRYLITHHKTEAEVCAETGWEVTALYAAPIDSGEETPIEASTPRAEKTYGAFHIGVVVKLLLDEALKILRPNSPEDCPEEPNMRAALGKKFWEILDGGAK